MLEFHLPDMSCGHCVATVTATVQALDPQAGIDIDKEGRVLRLQTALAREPLAAALAEAGYLPA